MKGILLKDLYAILKYCRLNLLLALVFCVVGFLGDGQNTFFYFYPFLMASMIPVTVIAYEEREHWTQYAGALPCTRAQLVTEKYLLALFCIVAFYLLSLIGCGVTAAFRAPLSADMLQVVLVYSPILGVLICAMTLPLILRFGVEKGRALYIGIFAIIGALIGGASVVVMMSVSAEEFNPPMIPFGLVPVAAILLLTLSWFIAVKLYQRREL